MLEFQSKRRFGIELEVGCTVTKPKIKKVIKSISNLDCTVTKYSLTGDDKVWHVKDDASCGPRGKNGPKGVEIASYVGQGIDDLKHMSEIAELLQKAGCEVNNNCGFHVHAEAVDLTPSQIGVLYSYWLKIEPILSLALPESRINNEYCRNINSCNPLIFKDCFCNKRNKIKDPLGIWEFFAPTDLSYYDNEDRRVNFNTVNYARADNMGSNHRKTLELRWPEGTLNARDVKSWVIIFLNFIDVCSKFTVAQNLIPYSNLSDVLTCLGLNHKTIRSPEKSLANIFDAKAWFLERIIKYGLARQYSNEVIPRMPAMSDKLIENTLKKAKSELKKMGVLEKK